MPAFTWNAVSAVLAVHDLEAAEEWYARWLGPPTVRPTPTVLEWVIAPSAWLQVVASPAAAGHTSAVLGVGDLRAGVTTLTGLGLEPGEVEDIPGIIRLSALRDPDGNTISLVEEL